MYIKIIGLIHLILYFIKNTYGIYSTHLINFGLKQLSIDKFYILLFIFLELSRWYNKNECLISYYIKKINNPNYKLGDNPENYEDMINIFNGNIKFYKLFERIMTIIYIYSIIIINLRNQFISNYLLFPFLLYYLLKNF